MQIGKITGREIRTNRDGSEDVVLLQVEVSDSDDIQTAELYRGAGVDCNPPDGSKVVLLGAGPAWQIAIAVNDNVTPEGLDEGEYQIYASDAGAKTANVKCEPGGDTVINDGTDYAVQYTELKSAFDQLTADFDALVAVVNGHVHLAPAGGGNTGAALDLTAPPPFTNPGQDTTADMTGSKVSSVRVSK